MPYCTHCGNQVSDGDRYCAKCGNPQGIGAPPPGPQAPAAEPPPAAGAQVPKSTYSIKPNHAALLCYIPQMGWIASVIFMSLEPYRSNRYIRFHALQGLFLFVLYLLAHTVFGFVPVPVFPFRFFNFRRILELLVVIAQVFGIVRTARGQDYRLPILSELAEKSMI